MKKPIAIKDLNPRILLVGIDAPYNKAKDTQAYYEEFLSLVKTLDLDFHEKLFLKLRTIDKATFLTKGKLQELIDFCNQNKFDEVVFSEILSPLQERNLEELLDCTVWDREKLILEIFRKSAHSAEGKIQVEMADLEFLKTRLAGKGVELAQQEGIVGVRSGPGETTKEVLKRHLAEKYRQAKKRLDVLNKSRDVQRKQRLKSKMPQICLVGYTNAGKSSLINILTQSNVLVEDKLFATLDTTTRELFVDGKKIALISDTVGFINQLPHHLIEAFKSTLDELHYASLLLHVVDLSNPAWQDQIKTVQKTLQDITVNKNVLYVFNKTDKFNKQDLEELKPKLQEYSPSVLAHAKSKDGVSDLVEYLKKYKF